MKPERWDDVHSAVQKHDAEGLRRIAIAASREQTRTLINLLADMLEDDLRNRRLLSRPAKIRARRSVRRSLSQRARYRNP
jgi:hypothetical protein